MNSNKFTTTVLPTPRLRSAQQGITLIDALIALVIFSVGLLALAALQTVSKQSNYEAMQRTNAAMYAYDLIERMRMNSDALASYMADPILSAPLAVQSGPCTTCAQPSTCTNCAVTAANDLFEWNKMVLGDAEKSGASSVGGLLNPSICLSGPGTKGKYTLAIAWRGQASIPITGTPANTCGSGLYDSAPGAGDYAYRRILVLDTYIGQ